MRTLAALLALAPALAAQDTGPVATQVYRKFSGQIGQVRVIDSRAATKSLVGSGFYANAEGAIVTNYHVIAPLVNEPAQHRLEWVASGDSGAALHILAVDVVNDLAIVSTGRRAGNFFRLAPGATPQGTRLYALGHPSEMGPSINEGTYNGLVPFTIAARIQFTGTITHGMSGGPAITADGLVVGVNVETFENGAGLLVPVDRVEALLARTSAPGYQPPKDLLADVGAQLVALQDRSLSALLADSTPMLALGPFSVPSQPASYLKCWGDATRHSEARRYDFAKHVCSTDTRIKLSGDQYTGYVYLNYYHYSSDELNPTNFYSLIQARFATLDDELEGDELEVTNFACKTRNIRTAPKDGTALTMRVSACLRRYRHLPGLYDAVTHVAVLGQPKDALIAVFILSGVTYETTQRLTARFVEHIR